MIADDDVRGWESRMLEWYGLEPDTSSIPKCIRPVAGKRHLWGKGRCICEYGTGHYREILDHTHAWRDPQRRYLYSAEPYTDWPLDAARQTVFDELCSAAIELGLQVTVYAPSESPRLPGERAPLIVFHSPATVLKDGAVWRSGA